MELGLPGHHHSSLHRPGADGEGRYRHRALGMLQPVLQRAQHRAGARKPPVLCAA
ncbi:hypothetical protein V498_08066, partial [Pseudogymnoascus sp. VKM F-4517 (FW-2822)]